MSPKPQRQSPAAKGKAGGGSLVANPEGLQVGDQQPQAATSQAPDKQTSDTPRYQEFVRSEARLRSDQLTGLAELRRRILASRQDKAERITDNTLIRVAVDLLLSQADVVSGDTEEQIRNSVINKDTK